MFYFWDFWAVWIRLADSVLIISYWITVAFPSDINKNTKEERRNCQENRGDSPHHTPLCVKKAWDFLYLLCPPQIIIYTDPFPLINFSIQHCSNQCVQVVLWKYIILLRIGRVFPKKNNEWKLPAWSSFFSFSFIYFHYFTIIRKVQMQTLK